MRVLVACEFSGVVREAFRRAGHIAVSCDLLSTDMPGPHYTGDVRDILDWGWDLMVAHPPCTYLTVSGARWMYDDRFPDRRANQDAAAEFFMTLWNSPIPRVAIENPVGVMSSRFRKPNQYIQPWQFGHPETKKTGLWLRGLPPLQETNVVDGREDRVFRLPPSDDRWRLRSVTYQGVADAMAAQWGDVALEGAA